MTNMFRHSIRRVTRCVQTSAPLGQRTHVPWARTHALGLPSQKYSVAADGKLTPEKKKQRDQSLLNMDIDAIEKNYERIFGDHTTWDHNKLRELVYVDSLIAPQDLIGFADYAISGYRPGGGSPSFPLMTMEELTLMGTPYSSWAPKPFNALNYSCDEALLRLVIEPDAENGLETLPRPTFHARLFPLRAKLWKGMVPISRDRWLEKKMDDPQNYQILMYLMHDIITIFSWLNHEQTLDQMRACFNWLVDQHVEFESAANLRREQNGIQERLNLAGMWAEYWNAIICTMSNRTHQWMVDRVDEVQTRAFAEYNTALQEAGSNQEVIGTAGKKYYECVQDLNSMMTRADYTLGVSMVGFKGYTSSGCLSDLSITARKNAYAKSAETKSWKYQETILQAQDREPPAAPDMSKISLRPEPAEPRFRDQQAFIGHYHEGKRNRTQIRKELRGDPKDLGEEDWVTILKDRMNFYLQNGRDRKTHRWGFVCYRLTYEQNDAEWAEFVRQFEADLFKSGDWIEGYDSIADMAGLEYIDGRDVGIAKGDIEAAKRHFKSTYTMLPTPGRMWTREFLVIDRQSYTSYAKPEPKEFRPPPPYGPSFGDRGGFVRLVDTSEYSQEKIDSLSPGYKGEVKVLSSLVFQELYPLLSADALRPISLWPLARLHPREVYAGHTVHPQEAWWEFGRIDAASMTNAVFKGLRKEKAALLKK